MATQTKVPTLALDYDVVLSAWEEIGGNAFPVDTVFLDDPENITLDLSSFEASLSTGACGNSSFGMFPVVPGVIGSSVSDFAVPSLPQVKVEPPGSPDELSFCDSAFNWPCPQTNCSGQPGFFLDSDWCIDIKSFDFKQETAFNDVGPTGSASITSSASQDVAVVPDVTSPYASSASAHNGCGFSLVPQGLPCTSMGLQLLPMGVNGQPLKAPGEHEVRTRKECLERYKEKKARRLYTKKIRYQLRKINADKRPRIKGRFVKKEELEEYLKQKSPVVSPYDGCSALDLEGSDVDDEDECDCD